MSSVTRIPCQICWLDDVKDSEIGELKCSCGHSFCKSCLCAWFQIFETPQGLHYKQHTPTCPLCRQEVNAWDIVRILGRGLRVPKDEEDQLFENLLVEEGAKKCPGCGIWIIRTEGCDHMRCYCGQDFCFECGMVECECGLDYGDNYTVWTEFSDKPCWKCGRYNSWSHCECGNLDEYEFDFFRQGVKESFGGRNTLLWKGNCRQKQNSNRQGQKKAKKEMQRKKQRAQRQFIQWTIAQDG